LLLKNEFSYELEVHMKKRWIILFCLLLALAACTANTVMEPEAEVAQQSAADTQPVPVERDTAEDEPVVESEAEPATQTDALAAVPVVRFTSARHELTLIDPQTSEEMAAFAPITIGRNYNFLLAPDGNTLAFIGYQTDDFYNGKLHLIDLRNWQAVETDIAIPRFSTTMTFSPDSTRLAIAHQGLFANSNGYPQGYKLTLIDVTSRTVITETEVAFEPTLLAFTPDGASLIAYGGQLAPQKVEDAEPAHAVMMNAADLSVTWEQLLPDVLQGNYIGEETAGGEIAMTGYHPAVVLSPDRMTLYIVHADDDRLTTVSFTERRMETVEVRPPQTFFDRLMALTAGVAHAKYYDGTDKQAVLSPDGSRLYVVGWTADTTVTEEGEYLFDSQSHGLKVIDTSDGTEITSLEIDAAGVAMAADGSQLYIYGWSGQSPYTDVYDPATLEKVKRLDGQLAFPGRTIDGRPLLLSNTTLMNNNQTRLTVLDPLTLERVSTKAYSTYSQFLTDQRLVGYSGH
jgi:hypothetical protein